MRQRVLGVLRWVKARVRLRYLCLAGVGVLLAPAAEGQVDGFFGGLLETFSSASSQWAAQLIGGSGSMVFPIQLTCLGLQFGVFGLRIALSASNKREGVVWTIVTRQLPLLLLLQLMLYLWSSYGLVAMDFFIIAGQELSGLEQGIDPQSLIGGALGLLALFTSPKLLIHASPLFPSPLPLLIIGMIFATVVAYASIAVRTVMMVIEGNVLATLGVIPVALGGWSVTAGFADNFFRYTARFGCEFMVLMLMVSAGSSFATDWGEEFERISAFDHPAIFVWVSEVTVTTIVWAMSVVVLPRKIAGNLVHLWTPGIEKALADG